MHAQAPETPKDPDVQPEIDALLRVRPDAPCRLARYAFVLEAELEHAHARQRRGSPPIARETNFT